MAAGDNWTTVWPPAAVQINQTMQQIFNSYTTSRGTHIPLFLLYSLSESLKRVNTASQRFHFLNSPTFFRKKQLTWEQKCAARLDSSSTPEMARRALQCKLTLDWRCTFWNQLTLAVMPPSRTVFWLSFISIIQMLTFLLIQLLGKSSNSSETSAFHLWSRSCRIVILCSAPNRAFPLSCCVLTYFLWSLKSLPLLPEFLPGGRTIFMPSSLVSLLGIRLASGLFTTFSSVFGCRKKESFPFGSSV